MKHRESGGGWGFRELNLPEISSRSRESRAACEPHHPPALWHTSCTNICVTESPLVMERREVALRFRFKYLLNAEMCSEIVRAKDLEPQFGVRFQERRFLWPWKMLRLRRRDRVVRGLVNSTFASKYDIFYSDHEAWPELSRPDISCPLCLWISKGRERSIQAMLSSHNRPRLRYRFSLGIVQKRT
jgi:hypothetical protein